MKKTMIALVATIMAGACVFFACSKEDETTAKNGDGNAFEKCKEFHEMLGEDAVIIGFASFDNPEEISYNFDFEVLAEKFHNHFKEETGIYVMLENFKIIPNEPLNPEFKRGEYQTSVFFPEIGKGATLWFYAEKYIDLNHGTVIYYVAPDGGGNQPNFICKQGSCKGVCERIAEYDDKGNMTRGWCKCNGGDDNPKHQCIQESVNGGNNNGGNNVWNTIWGKIGDCIVALIGKIK